MNKLNWGIIGTGAIAHAFAHGLAQSETGRLLAVGSRSQETADKFGDEFGVERRYATYEQLLADPDVEAVYISTPHPLHAEWAIKALEAKKNVLCEKPAALNHGQLMTMIEAARENDRLFMEAFMYRCHPQTAKLVELLKQGVIGEVRMIRAAFGFGGGTEINAQGRMFNPELGGGGIMDVGCYSVSMARLVAGTAMGRAFADPIAVVAGGRVGKTGVDEWTAAVLTFENDIIAQVSTAVRSALDNTVEVYGSEGKISVSNPWVANRKTADNGKIVVTVKGESKTYDVPADKTSFAIEADRVARTIAEGKKQADSPAMSWDDSLGNLATLDRWREAVGVEYPHEKPARNAPLRGKLRKRADAPMKYGTIDGISKPVSKMIMGCDNQPNFPHAAAIWDDWIERGGNAFDTSWVYGRGKQEILLGQWVGSRGVRDDIVVTVKGAHTPRCLPDLLVDDFNESLERLGFEYADIYVMHRDNLDVPIGEFVDVLNELVSRGLIRGALGGSNWSIERFEAANEYAKKTGKQGMTILNNNLSLARMVKPVWNGCIHVSDTSSREWLRKTGTTNFSWSSQARGYFLPEAERMKLGAGNFECWDAPDNRERRARAEELAKKKGCSPINIAAAYVLCQPFPSFALVGPRTIHETATTMPALGISLSQEEIEWLWGSDK
ncbi:MAG: oxidoreductase [Spirochaetaceae bacterium]|nr:MAG: oxidoreductase [Spirochaetaceae bacterium]